MADVIVLDSAQATLTENRHGLAGPFWVNPTTGYIYLNGKASATDADVYKTTDSGASWAVVDDANGPEAVGEMRAQAQYFDGTKIHVAYLRTGNNTIHYMAFNTATDTWSSPVTVATAFTVSATSTDTHCAITKAVGGNLYIAAKGNGAGSHAFFRSVDAGANWTVRTDWCDAGSVIDEILLAPGNRADNQDILAIYFDYSALTIDRRLYDDSANTFGATEEANIATIVSYGAVTYDYWWHAVRRNSDGAVITAFWNAVDVTTADLQIYAITETSITSLTNVVTNVDDCAGVEVFIDQQIDKLYVVYLGTNAGTDTWTSLMSCYYQTSTDGGTTWSGQLAYGTENDDLRAVSAGQSVGAAGGRFMPVWFDDDDQTFTVNDGNDIEIPTRSMVRRRRHGGLGSMVTTR